MILMAPGSRPRPHDLDDTLLSEDILPDWYDDWVLIERERFRQLRLHALDKLCEGFVHMRMFGQAVQAGMASVTEEPLRESAQRLLIGAYLGEGNHAEALRQYRSYRDLLKSELGITTHEMVRRVAHAFGVPSTAIGTAGQKDRQAIARQVISVPGVDPVKLESRKSRILF